MKKTVLRQPLLWLSLMIGTFPSFAAEPPPIEAFGNLPAERDPVVSPDGHWIAWMDQREVKPRIVVFDVQNRKVQRIMAAPELVKLRRMVWSDSDTLLVTLSETKLSESQRHASREYFKIIAFDAAGGPTRMLPIDTRPSKPVGLEAQMLLTHSGTPHTAIMAIQMRDGNCLIAVDTHTGTWSVTKYGNRFTVGWVTDRRGNAVLREDWDWKTHTYRLLVLKEEPQKPVEILRRDDANAPKLMGLLPDGSAVMLLDTNGHAHQAAWALPLDGSPMKLLVEDPEADVTNVYLDRDTGAPIGVYVSGSVTTVHWLEPPAQHRQDVLQRSFPDREVVLAGWTDGGNKALVQVQGPATPPTYYLVDFTTHRADIAAEEYPALNGVEFAPTKQITYQARDGTEIPAYLTVPTKAVGALPLIVLPHGGPNARDYLQFDWLVQFLASRGYVVLRPQFRGSTGFGDAFLRAGFRQWGGLMQDDVTDGVNAMIHQGVADAQRVCVVGASYGGYVALAGAAFTPDLYQCAVSIAGVSDLRALVFEDVPGYGTISAAESYIKERVGPLNDPNLVSKSPLNAVGRIHIPILIMYGTGDGVVPTGQSERMAKALREAGKPVKVVTLDKEDHWLSRSESRIQVLRELETFLKENLSR
jgi:dipeptidyl aminopeptidase/acylaminoacyl peptidase